MGFSRKRKAGADKWVGIFADNKLVSFLSGVEERLNLPQ